MLNWINKIRRKRRTKKFIKSFLDNISDSVLLKKWEHNYWGDAIYVNKNGFYGHLSGIRGHRIGFHCDLRDRDIIVTKIPKALLSESNGKKYEIGLFANVQVQRDPPDMFFAQYVHLGFADDFSMETIVKLANERIASLKLYSKKEKI